MDNHTIYYDTIIKLTTTISQCKNPEKVALVTVKSVRKAFSAKGCSIFLVNRATKELGLVASDGLSPEYLNKGTIHFMQSIKEAKDAVPIAIHDVTDDPRIEYPEAMAKEGISSMLGVPIISNEKIIGALRIYIEKPWEFSLNDIAMVQAVAMICGMAMEMSWMYQDHEDQIETMKTNCGCDGEDTFGLAGVKDMNQLLRSIRGLKIPPPK